MKRLFSAILMLVIVSGLQAISPYLHIADLKTDIESIEKDVKNSLEQGGFEIIGNYHPANNTEMVVIVYTSEAIKKACLSADDRGLLAAALKIGIRKRKDILQVTMLNPAYLFNAYLGDNMNNKAINSAVMSEHQKALTAMEEIGTKLSPFGGDIKVHDLRKYKYMMGMPKFDAPVELAQFNNFEEALIVIQKNLTAKKGGTVKVYELISSSHQVATLGVGLLDPDKGEAHFLPIIGQKHIAAMPYEIIIEKGTVSMLHGRYRFASHWPELTMGTFTKIMSSPGDVEEFMKALTE